MSKREVEDIRVKLVLAEHTISSGRLDSPAVKKITDPYSTNVGVIGLLYFVEEDLQFPGYLKEMAEKHEWFREKWPNPTREGLLNEALKKLNDLPKEIREDKHLTDEDKRILYEAVEYSATHLPPLMKRAGYTIVGKK